MTLTEIVLTQVHPLLLCLIVAWAFFEAVRAWANRRAHNRTTPPKEEAWEVVAFRYVPDIVLYVVSSLTGWGALIAAYKLAEKSDYAALQGGPAALLIFLCVVGVVGITGHLPNLIVRGRLPGFGGG